MRNEGDFENLRIARDDMSSKFPLTEDLWIQFIDDEILLSKEHNLTSKESIIELMEKSVQDYISVSLWLKYCQFLIDNMSSISDIAHVRQIFEKGLDECGLHVTESCSLWESYIDFETGIFNSYLEQYSISNDKTIDQAKKVLLIYKRMCSIPLIGLENFIKTFKKFTETYFPKEYDKMINEHVLSDSLKKFTQCYSFEEKLVLCDPSSMLEIIKEYINYEIKCNEPMRAYCLYERAIKISPLCEELWRSYINFMSKNNMPESMSLISHDKSIRNMPWVPDFWISYMEALESYNGEESKIYDLFIGSLKLFPDNVDNTVKLCLSWIGYKRRQSMNLGGNNDKNNSNMIELVDWCVQMIEKTSKQIKHIIPLIKFKCHLLFLMKKSDESIELWYKILAAIKFDDKIWMNFIDQLEKYGNYDQLHQAYIRICQIPLDNPEYLYEKFLNHEFTFGTLTSLKDAQQKVDDAKNKHSERIQKRKRPFTMEKYEYPDDSRENKKSKKHNNMDDKKSAIKKNRERDNDGLECSKNKNRSKEQSSNGIKDENSVNFVINDNSMDVSSESNLVNSLNDITVSSESKRQYDDKNTVFLSNLSFNVDKDKIYRCLHECGPIKEIRLVEKKGLFNKSRCKGFAYVEFMEEDGVNKALHKDRCLIDGRPVYIARSADKSNRKPAHKSSQGIDKKTLYVSGLPYHMTKDELSNLLKMTENLKEIRLVTNKSGRSKGFAYVEYMDEISASKAIITIDGYLLDDGHKLAAAISNAGLKSSGNFNKMDVSRDKNQNEFDILSKNLYMTKPKIGLTPRSIIKNKLTNQTTSSEQDSGESHSVNPKSNSEFRKMFGIK